MPARDGSIDTRRPFDRWADPLRWGARGWITILTVAALVLAWGEVPDNPDVTDWTIYARIGLLIVVALGALGSLLHEGIGGAVIIAGAVGLGALVALDSELWRAFAVALLFFVPGVVFLLLWHQRTRRRTRTVALLGGLCVVLLIGGIAASRIYDTYFAPIQPESSLEAQPSTLVDWIWAGGTTETSVVVKAALRHESTDARLAVSARDDLSEARLVTPVADPTGIETDLLTFVVDGLTPDTDYWYAIAAEGTMDEARRGHVRTFPVGAASFTFAFGSCANTGSNGVVFDTIREIQPLFMLSTGDLHYRNIGKNDPAVYRAAYDDVLASPSQSRLYRSTPIVYVWDDHDFGPNDADRTSPGREAAQFAYRRVVPHYPLPAGEAKGPIYQSFTVGRVRFIVTDASSERSPADAVDDRAKTVLGSEQKAWLKQELLNANGRYPAIVWVNSQPWIGAPGEDAVGWADYTTERQELATFIAQNDIQGLMMLSGDAHMLAIDDGSNSNYAVRGDASFPVFHAAALDRRGSEKGGPYSEGAYPGGGQFGVMTVNDAGGPRIEIVWSGRNYENEEVVGYRFTVAAPPP